MYWLVEAENYWTLFLRLGLKLHCWVGHLLTKDEMTMHAWNDVAVE
jgi:hypothetical protein